MKLKLFRNYFIPVFVCISMLLVAGGCKKDKISVDEIKEYEQEVAKVQGVQESGWWVTLNPDGSADILPAGDIVYRGTYKINGARLKLKTDQSSFDFDIISQTEIKEKKYGVTLKLKQ